MKFLFLLMLSNIILKVNKAANLNKSEESNPLMPECKNRCLSCQNTLYYLKFHGDAACRFNVCSDLCLSLTGQWNSYGANHLTFFREDKINICETCFRYDHCHINDCMLEKTIIKHSIDLAMQNFQPHLVHTNEAVLSSVQKNAEDYFFNMDFIFKNLDKVISLLGQYNKVYHNSVKLINYLKNVLNTAARKINISVHAYPVRNEEILSRWKDIAENLHIYKEYYMNLKNDKAILNQGRVYLTTEIVREENKIKNFLDFDMKVKVSLEKAQNVTEYYQLNIRQNLADIHQMLIHIDVCNSKLIDYKIKQDILNGKTTLTNEMIQRILNEHIIIKEDNPTVNYSKLKTPVQSISIAGKKIEVKKNKKDTDDDDDDDGTYEDNQSGYEMNDVDVSSNLLKDKAKNHEKFIKEPSLGLKESIKIQSSNFEEDEKNNESYHPKKMDIRIKEPILGGHNGFTKSTKILSQVSMENKLSNIIPNPFPTTKDPRRLPSQSVTIPPSILPLIHSGQHLPSDDKPLGVGINPITGQPAVAVPLLSKLINDNKEIPNNSYNKNIFKPYAKIDDVSKSILGIDHKPSEKEENPAKDLPMSVTHEQTKNSPQIPQAKEEKAAASDEFDSNIIEPAIPAMKIESSKENKQDSNEEDSEFEDPLSQMNMIQKNTNKKSLTNELKSLDLSGNLNFSKGRKSLDQIKSNAKNLMNQVGERVKNSKIEEKKKEVPYKANEESKSNASIDKIPDSTDSFIADLESKLKSIDKNYEQLKEEILLNLIN